MHLLFQIFLGNVRFFLAYYVYIYMAQNKMDYYHEDATGMTKNEASLVYICNTFQRFFSNHLLKFSFNKHLLAFAFTCI